MRIIIFISILFLSACNFFEEKDNEQAIARVGNQHLFYTDVEEVIPEEAEKEDSILIADSYIHNWIKETLILQKAELNLKENQKEFKKQLEDYRNSLIMYSYEKELIRQKLDTNVYDNEILTYYNANKQNFELKDNITKVKYLKVAKNAPQLKKIRKVYKSSKPEDVEKLKEYAHQYAEKFHLNDNQWILFDELLREVPLNIKDTKGFFKNVKHLEVEDSLSYYFVHIKNYKLEKDVSPLSFEKDNIKNILINKRKLDLIKTIKNDLYQEALSKKRFEIYDTKK